MTSGSKAERIAEDFLTVLCAGVIALSLQPFARAAQAADIDVAKLMQMLSEVHEAGGVFTEYKYLSVLNEPLVARGRVHYQAPDYIRKEYDDPDSESYEVRGDNLTIEYPDGRRRDLSIGEHPVLRAFVESYRATLTGDRETLSRHFNLELSGPVGAWVLRLTPRDAELGDYLNAVIIHGRESTIYSVETVEANGDRSVMTLINPGV
jgi:outer membrane lipoprotein-sorting protein